MAMSQNGYRSRDYSLIATYTIARDVKISLRKGDVSVVLLHFARWYDQNIEPLTKKDTGGYNPRAIAGSNIDSNHASGTAMDLRWQKHPVGKKGTFTKGQKDKIHTQLKFYEGVIRWGEDYKSNVDGMHYEINKPASDVARIARKCKVSMQPKPPAKPVPLIVDGDLGPKTIARWRELMNVNVRGELTAEFIKVVQGYLRVRVDQRLKVDGDLGRKTIAALQRYLKTPVDGVMSKPVSEVVKALQRRLNTGKF